MKLIIRSANGETKVVELDKDVSFSAKKGQQFIFSDGFSSYTMSFKDDQKSIDLNFKVDGKDIKVSLNGIVPHLSSNNDGMMNPTALVINKNANEKNIEDIVNNKVFNGSEIIDNLEALISGQGDSLALATDFASLVETLEAAAAGGEGAERSSGVNAQLAGAVEDSLFGLQETAIWENLERSIFSLPVDTGDILTAAQQYIIMLEGLKVTNVIEGDKAKYKVSIYDANGNPIEAPEDITVTFKYTYKSADGDDIVELESVTIPKGQTGIEFEIDIVDDVYAEGTEDFEISIDDITTESTDEIILIKDGIETTITDETDPYVPTEPVDPNEPVNPNNPVDPSDPNEPKDPSIPNTLDNVNVDIIGVTTEVYEGESFEYKVTLTDDYGRPVIATKDITFEVVYKYKTAIGDDIVEVKSVTVKAGSSESTFKIATIEDDIVETVEAFDITLNKNNVVGADQFEHLTVRDRDIESTIIDNDEHTVTVDPTDPTDPNTPDIPGKFDGNKVENGDAKIPEGNDALFKTDITNPSSKDEIIKVTINNVTTEDNDLILNEVKFYDKNGNELESVNKGNGEFEVKLPAGETEFYTKVPTFDDLIIEDDEQFSITVEVGDKEASSTGTIIDNDVPEAEIVPTDPQDPDPEVPVDPTDPQDPTKPLDPKDPAIGTKGAVADEGKDLVFTVTVTDSVNPQEYDFVIKDGTAEAGNDFTTDDVEFTNDVTYDPTTGKITVPAGVTEFEVVVKTIDDDIIENTESLTVSVGDSTAVGYIIDNDKEATITPKDPQDPDPEVPVDPTDPQDPTKPLDPKDPAIGTKGAVADEGKDLVFTVTVTDSVNPQEYDFVIKDGTAEAGNDFTTDDVEFTNDVTYDPTTGKITVPAGVTEFEVVVKTIDDDIIENTESLTVSVGDSTAVGYIIDNDKEATITPKDPQDPDPEVPVDPTDPQDPTKPLDPKDPAIGTKGAVADEGKDLVFTVTVTDSVNPQEYDFVIKDGTAEAGNDFTTDDVEFTNDVTYDPTTGKITVPAGVTEFEVVVKTIDDDIIENTESLTVSVGDSTAVGYIIDNDKEATITPKDPQDPDPEVPVDPTDPQDPTKPLDPKDPAIGTKGAVADEGKDLVFTVTVTDSVNPQEYDFVIKDGTAEAGNDFTTDDVEFTNDVTYDPTTGKITVPAGVTEFEVVVKTIDDDIIENTESLTVSVGDSTAVGYIIDNDKEATITPKDPQDPDPEVPVDPTDPQDPTKPLDPKDPAIGTKGAVADEGKDLVFTVTVTDSVNPQEYDFVIKDGTAEAGNDFTTDDVEFTNDVTYDPTTGKITVPAGVTEFEVVVKTIDDDIIENTESLTVSVGDSTAVGYIIDNDKEATITPKDPQDPDPEVPVDPTDPQDPTKPLDPKDPAIGTKGAVADEGKDLVFTVTVTDSVNPQEYDFVIKDGTAEAGNDFTTDDVEFTNDVTYDPTTGKITVPAGVTEFEVVVKTIDDDIIENTESLTVSVGDSTAVGYIIDNDKEATITPKDPQDPDPEVPVDPTDPQDPTKPLDPKDPAIGTKGAVADEGKDLVFTVTVTDSVNPQEYDFVIKDGTAEAGNDFTTDDVEFTNDVTYDPTTGKITVPAGVTEFEVVVKTIDDDIIENTESLTVSVGDSTAVGYIIDNDKEATITPKDPQDPDPEVPVDPTDPQDPTKPLDPKDPAIGTKGAVADEGKDLVFTVTVTDSVNPQEYDFVIKDGTAEAGNDFTTDDVEFTNDVTYDPTTGKITVPAGVTEFEVVVKTIDDDIIENTESLTVSVGDSTAVGYIIDNDKEATITPKDPQDPDPEVPVDPTDPQDPTKPLDPKDPAIGTKGAVADEGKDLVFTVTVTDSVNPQEYDFVIKDGTAEAGNDFTTDDVEFTNDVTYDPTTGKITVPAGVTEFEVVVKTIDDDIIENTESLTVSVGDSTAVGYIIDNDKEATITPKDPQDPDPEVPVDPTDPQDPTKPLDPKDPAIGTKGAVADEGKDLVFTVTVTDSVNPQEYDFVIKDGTAEAGNDFTTDDVEFTNDVTYDPTTGKITVPAGVTEFEVVVKTIDDDIIENTESLTVSVGDSTAVGYIIDNDFKLADEDSFKTNEDTPHTLKIDDFGVETDSSVTEVKITELPTNGQLTLNGVEVEKYQVITRYDIDSGKLVFTPNKDTDEDGSFKFLVNDGSKWANIESTTTIEVIAVADKPDVQINISERVEKIVNENCDTNDVSGSNGNNGTINPDFNKDDIVINKGDYNNFINKSDLDCGVTLTDKKILDKTNDLMTVDGGMKNHSVNFGGGALNALEVENSINWGNIYGNSGDDTVVVGQNIEKSTVNLGSGDNGLKVEDSIKLSTVHTYSGDDKVVVGKDVDNTTINVGGGTNYLEVGNNVNWSNLFGGAGNDTFVVDGSIDRTTVNLGAGKNSLDIGGELDLSTVHSGSFNDSVSVGRDVKKSTINLGDGKNSIDVDGDVTKSNLFTLSGDDVVNIKKDVSDTVVNLGFGHNEFNSNDFNRSSIHTYSGNDNVTINGDVKQGLINLGAGKNTLDVKGNTEKGTILTGLNKDTIVLEGDVSNTYVNTGSGDDKIFVGGKATATTIDGGAGQDTLYLPKDLSQYSFYDGIVCKKPTTYEDFMAKNSGKYGISCHTFYIVDNETGSTLTVRNIEFLEFNTKASDLIEDSSSSNGGNNDGNIPADAEYLYTYDIDLSAKLKDTDGSETLTVRLEGLPSGIMIDDPRYTYDAVNGAYIVEVDGISFNDTLTFQTYEKIEDEVLNSIKLVAISKESSNESTAMAEVTRDESTIIDREKELADSAKASIFVSKIEANNNLIGSFDLDIQNSGKGYTHSHTGKDVKLKIISTDKILKATDDYVLVEKNFISSTINLGEGTNALDIKGSVDWGNIYAGKKDDTVVVDGEVKRTTVNLGFGDNSMKIGTNMDLSTLHTYAGDDNLQIGNNLTNSTVNLGDGTNTIEIGNKVDWSNILALSGNDTVKVAGTIDHTTVNLGAGDNELYVGKNFQTSTVHTLGGDDTVWIKENLQGSTINLGNGANTLVVENKEGKTAAAITSNSTIITGSGEDKVLIDGYIKNTNIFTGAGNDTIFVANGGEKCTMIDGGSGYDVLHLSKSKENYRFEVGIICKKPITWEEFMAQNKGLNGLNCKTFTIYELNDKGELTGNKFEIRNIEEVQFNAKLSDFVEVPTQDFKVDLSASLVDRDGSESLSVKITGIKDDWELEGNNCNLVKENDGSYTVTLPAGAKDYSDSLILKTPEGTDSKDIDLKITAVATEVRDGTTAITEASSDGSMKLMGEAIDLGKIISENTKTISMENGKADKMKISLDEILDLEYREIEIKGDKADTIQLGKDIWEVGKTNNGYTEYTGKGANSTVKLIIDNDIKIDEI